MGLTGYVRADGRIGFRNHVLVLPLTGCLMSIADRIARKVPGATCFAHPNGCDLQQRDFELMGNILEHTATHPNVGGVIFLAMGCAATLSLKLPGKVRESGRAVEVMNAYDGTTRTVEKGVELAQAMLRQLSMQQRQPVPVSALTIGTKCGASDENSYTCCNPVVGRACDMLAEQGATIVLSEDCELAGCAEQLAERARTKKSAAKIRKLAGELNIGWKTRFGETFEEVVLKDGTSREDNVAMSLNRAGKAGTGPITGFFDMSKTVNGPGLVILNAPNSDLENVTCLAAAGCNVTLFTTGRGTPVGSPTSITVKVTGTQATYDKMNENIDVCVAGLTEESGSLDEGAGRVVQAVLDAANGRMTKAERLCHWEVAMPIRGVTY